MNMINNSKTYETGFRGGFLAPDFEFFPATNHAEPYYFHGGCKSNNDPDSSKRSMEMTVFADGNFLHNRLNGGSNNEAAFRALIMGMEHGLEKGKKCLMLFGHNEFVIKASNEERKISKADNLIPLLEKFRQLKNQFELVDVSYIKIDKNLAARQ